MEDLPGSALDAQVLALYVWLATRYYDEYRRNTVCLCIAENLSALDTKNLSVFRSGALRCTKRSGREPKQFLAL